MTTSHTLETSTNTLNGSVYAFCTCDTWRRVWDRNMFPGLQEAEAEHEAHRRHAGAEELRTGAIPVIKSHAPDSLDALVSMTKAIADAAQAMNAANERFQGMIDEFIQAHQEACDRGIGVVVVRKADGSITSTPNVFLKPGQVVFMEDPETLLGDIPGVKLTMAPEVPEYLPRYQVVTPERLGDFTEPTTTTVVITGTAA